MQSRLEIKESNQVKHNKAWVILEELRLVEIILRSIGDEDKKSIITSVIQKSQTISNIIENVKIPQTSGYRKINALIEDGLLIPRGYVTTSDRRRITKYGAIFDDVNILLEKDKVVVKIHIQDITDMYKNGWKT